MENKKIFFQIQRGSQFDIIINNCSIRTKVFNLIPLPIMNKILLTFPSIYKMKIVNYESVLTLNNGIQELLNEIKEVKNIEGNIIECGSARCGTTAIMGNFLIKNKINKQIYACDSFEGFFNEEIKNEKKRGLTLVKESAFTYTSYDYVIKKIKKLKLSNKIIIVKGFFNETLSNIDSKFSLALIDADLEQSVTDSAELVWPKLSIGGVMLFDEYRSDEYKGAKLAIDRFVINHKDEIHKHYMMDRLFYVQKK